MQFPERVLLILVAGSVALWAQQGGFSLDNLDRTADPCVDFYQYACGNWIVKNPIPPDQSSWGTFNIVAERNRAILRDILDKAAVNDPKRDQPTRKIGDFYAACMDEAQIEKQGLAPLKPLLDAVAAMQNKAGLQTVIPLLQKDGINIYFGFDSSPDLKNSAMNLAEVDQAGLGLPDRDYYLRDDAMSASLRKQYVEHVQRMLQLAGYDADRAAAGAQTVLNFETDLAKGSLDLVSRRDPEKIYHKLPVSDLARFAPFLNWPRYFTAMGAPAFEMINITSPEFFKALNSAIAQHSVQDLQVYMRWHVLHNEAPFLPKAFVEENFSFYGKVLTGTPEERPRWRRCVDAVDADLGFALGEKYVDVAFGVEGKQRTLKMVEQIEKALGSDIETLSWMTPATKKEALIKLHAVTNKIGYPDEWRDYSSVKIDRTDAIGNDLRATAFEVNRIVKRIGKPVDRKEWFMTPQTVNAYYDPTQNNINFPAGILQPPFFDNKLDAAVNYGGIGMVIGHELTHGFDDQGRQFGPQGNLMDWWTPEDAKEFEKRAQCFVDEYSAFVVAGDVHLNGKLTLGENTADNGGLRIAFNSLMDWLKTNPEPKINGFTPQQRYFLGFAQGFCEQERPEEARRRAQTDPHSPGRDRVNGTVSNMTEFQNAFSCKLGQPMVRQPACRVW